LTTINDLPVKIVVKKHRYMRDQKWFCLQHDVKLQHTPEHATFLLLSQPAGKIVSRVAFSDERVWKTLYPL